MHALAGSWPGAPVVVGCKRISFIFAGHNNNDKITNE
jgi:hypothetical protein